MPAGKAPARHITARQPVEGGERTGGNMARSEDRRRPVPRSGCFLDPAQPTGDRHRGAPIGVFGRPASSTSRIFRASASDVYGLARNAVPGSIRPWCATARSA